MAKKIALVTGAMGGLGTAICKSLAQSGFTVVANCLPNFPPKDEWLAKTGTKSAMEESMLDFAEGVEPNSRLACQIKMSDALDGLVVNLPESQH